MTRNNVVPGVPSFREELDVSMTTIRVPFRKNGKDSFLMVMMIAGWQCRVTKANEKACQVPTFRGENSVIVRCR